MQSNDAPIYRGAVAADDAAYPGRDQRALPDLPEAWADAKIPAMPPRWSADVPNINGR